MTYGGWRTKAHNPGCGRGPAHTNFTPADAKVHFCLEDCPPLHSARGPAQLSRAPPPSRRSHSCRPAQRASSKLPAVGHAGKCSPETGAGEPREVTGSRHLSSRLSRTPGPRALAAVRVSPEAEPEPSSFR